MEGKGEGRKGEGKEEWKGRGGGQGWPPPPFRKFLDPPLKLLAITYVRSPNYYF